MSNKNIQETDNIGSRLQQYRQSKNLTGKQLADIIGISQGSLSELENGKRDPSGKVLSGIAEKTDIDLNWLITGKKIIQEVKGFKKDSKFEILAQAEEWLSEEVKKNPKREIWFEVEFEKAFQEFKAWKDEREGKGNYETGTQAYKVA